MNRYAWSRLNKLQVGKYVEYFVKMELTMYGFEVYTTEVDDHCIDFIVRRPDGGPFLEVQVKGLREEGYVYLEKSKFELRDNLYVAFALLNEGKPPVLYLIPSKAWENPNHAFRDRNYEGRKSEPEWGLNISRRNLPALEPYGFEATVTKLCAES